MVYTPLDLRATAGQMYATAADVAWTIVARRLGEAVAFGVASTDITAHRAYRNQWSVARCGFLHLVQRLYLHWFLRLSQE